MRVITLESPRCAFCEGPLGSVAAESGDRLLHIDCVDDAVELGIRYKQLPRQGPEPESPEAAPETTPEKKRQESTTEEPASSTTSESEKPEVERPPVYSDNPMRICSVCGSEKPDDLEHFCKAAGSNKTTSCCRVCRAETMAKARASRKTAEGGEDSPEGEEFGGKCEESLSSPSLDSVVKPLSTESAAPLPSDTLEALTPEVYRERRDAYRLTDEMVAHVLEVGKAALGLYAEGRADLGRGVKANLAKLFSAMEVSTEHGRAYYRAQIQKEIEAKGPPKLLEAA